MSGRLAISQVQVPEGYGFDGDGTCWPNTVDGIPSQKTVDTVRRSIAEGIHAFLVTGRPPHMCMEHIQMLGLKDPCVVGGGSRIISPDGDVRHSVIIPADITQRILASCLPLCAPYGNPIWDSDVPGTPSILDWKEFPARHELCIAQISPDRLPYFEEQLASIELIAAHKVTGNSKQDTLDIHITHKEADKAASVVIALEMIGIDPKNVWGFGDNYNDLGWLEKIGFAIAMGNGPIDFQHNQIIQHIALPVEQDGMAQTIQEYILNK